VGILMGIIVGVFMGVFMGIILGIILGIIFYKLYDAFFNRHLSIEGFLQYMMPVLSGRKPFAFC
jgi:uncharacterized membrane protein